MHYELILRLIIITSILDVQSVQYSTEQKYIRIIAQINPPKLNKCITTTTTSVLPRHAPYSLSSIICVGTTSFRKEGTVLHDSCRLFQSLFFFFFLFLILLINGFGLTKRKKHNRGDFVACLGSDRKQQQLLRKIYRGFSEALTVSIVFDFISPLFHPLAYLLFCRRIESLCCNQFPLIRMCIFSYNVILLCHGKLLLLWASLGEMSVLVFECIIC